MFEFIEQVIVYIRGIWRYRWWAMAAAWLVAVGGWLFVAQLPDEYEAGARVYVDTASILRPLLRGLAVQTDLSQRIQLMNRTLLSRPNLEKVVRMTDLDITAKTPEQMEDLLDQLSNDIRLTNDRGRQNLYSISFLHQNPEVAKKVVQSLLTIFVESTLGGKRQDVDAAHKFLDQQIKEYEAKLVAAEERLKDFKRKNVDVMPSSGNDYYARMQEAKTQLQQARLLLSEEVRRRDEMRRQLRGEEPAFGFGPATSRTASHPFDGRISALQARLDDLLLQYTENHPDVMSIKDVIASLEAQKQADLKVQSDQGYNMGALETNPVYQQMKISLASAEANVASLSVRVQEYAARVDRFNKLIDTIPEIEAQMKRLNRDYAVNKENYDELVSRRESAKISESAEQAGDNVKFKVIDPPRVPLTPAAPNRPLLSSIVVLAALGVGFALAFLMSQIRPVVYDRRTLRRITGFPVFGTVSRVWTPELLMKRKLEVGALVSAGLVFAISYIAILLFAQGVLDDLSVIQKFKAFL